MVSVTYNKRCDYWVVDIQCKDRQKLLFDTVCTLADMGYDVYHATIDGEQGNAHQEVRPTSALPAAVTRCLHCHECAGSHAGRRWPHPAAVLRYEPRDETIMRV